MLAQAVTGTPGHINTMAEAVKTLRARFADAGHGPGDIYLTNDPWIASGHLNDFLLMMPVFHEGAVIGFTACTSHLIDLGGLGMGPEGSDIHDEGLLIPPCKLVDRGAVNTLLMEIVKANSREPIANEGDIYALMACCEAGAARLQAMISEFGLSDLDTLADYIIETSRKGTLDAIADLPKGTWSSTLRVDGYDRPLDLCASLTIAETASRRFHRLAPLRGQGHQRAAELRHRLHGLRAPLPDRAGHPEQRGVPREPFTVTAPPGCILNAQPPPPSPCATPSAR
jgi:N-methylhydantoinase B